MNWKIITSKNSQKFIDKNDFDIAILNQLILRALGYLKGQQVNIDIKRLEGKWTGFYRIRKGKVRIIAEFDFEKSVVFIEEIDWRGNIYK